LHGLPEFLHLALDDRREIMQAPLLRRVVGGELLQLTLEQSDAVAGLAVRLEVVVLAREQESALAGLRVAQGDGQILHRGEHAVAVLRPFAGLPRGPEPFPGHAAHEGEDGEQDREDQEIGAGDEALGHVGSVTIRASAARKAKGRHHTWPQAESDAIDKGMPGDCERIAMMLSLSRARACPAAAWR
jgi:hypothetical protein